MSPALHSNFQLIGRNKVIFFLSYMNTNWIFNFLNNPFIQILNSILWYDPTPFGNQNSL